MFRKPTTIHSIILMRINKLFVFAVKTNNGGFVFLFFISCVFMLSTKDLMRRYVRIKRSILIYTIYYLC